MTEPVHVAATRRAYDIVAVDYAALLRDELAAKPFDRAMLAIFAEAVHARGGGEVADLGCGPGRITAHLASLGLEAFGVDLSPGMISVARRDHPELHFEVGNMDALPIDVGAVAGAVAWYSVIHTPPERQGPLFAEFARVLRPRAPLLLAFQLGDGVVHLQRAYGHEVEIDTYRQAPTRIRSLLSEAGLTELAWLERAPVAPEKARQAYVLAERAEVSAG